MSVFYRGTRLFRAAVFVLALPIFGRAQSISVPEKYIVYNVDRRGLFDKALNALGVPAPVGRSFALIAGVTRYPDLPPTKQTLQAAQVDSHMDCHSSKEIAPNAA